MQELFSLGHLPGDHLGRKQPFEEVVVAEVAVAPCEADRARDRVRLEHRATAFSGIPNQSFVGPGSPLEVTDDNGPLARIRSSTRSATAALSARAARGTWPLRPQASRNQGNSLVGTNDSALLVVSKISRRS